MEKFKPLLKPCHTNENDKLRKLGSTQPEDAFTVSLFQTTLLSKRILQSVYFLDNYAKL